MYHFDLKKFRDNNFRECLIALARPGDELKPEVLTEIIEHINNTMLKENLFAQPSLIFVVADQANEKEYTEYMEDAFSNSYVANQSDFIRFLNAEEPQTEIFVLLREKGLDALKCPFQHLGPCPPDIFVGREQLINEILFGEQNAFAISGGRRIGKTSLLFKLKSEAEKGNEYQCLYIDCSTLQNFQGLINEIFKKLFPRYYYHQHIREGEGYKLSFEDILKRVRSLNNKTLLLLLDEMDILIKNAREISEDTNIFDAPIRDRTNQGEIRLVISGFRRVFEMITDGEHPFYNLCAGKILGILNQDDVRKLVSLPILNAGIVLKDKDDIITRIYQNTNGYPSVVQYIARMLFLRKKGNEIKGSDLDEVLKAGELIDYVMENFIMNTSPLEKLICAAIVDKDFFDMDKLTAVFARERIRIKDPTKCIYAALRNLHSNSILINEEGQYGFLYPLMKDVIREHFAKPNVINALKQEVMN
jgi:Cdc6-like AAA superfamily ATPase